MSSMLTQNHTGIASVCSYVAGGKEAAHTLPYKVKRVESDYKTTLTHSSLSLTHHKEQWSSPMLRWTALRLTTMECGMSSGPPCKTTKAFLVEKLGTGYTILGSLWMLEA